MKKKKDSANEKVMDILELKKHKDFILNYLMDNLGNGSVTSVNILLSCLVHIAMYHDQPTRAIDIYMEVLEKYRKDLELENEENG